MTHKRWRRAEKIALAPYFFCGLGIPRSRVFARKSDVQRAAVDGERGFLDDLGERRVCVARARKIQRFLSQPFFVAEVFTGSPGKYVKLEDTIKGFKMILNGELDDLPEQAFYLVGDINEAIEKAKKLQG